MASWRNRTVDMPIQSAQGSPWKQPERPAERDSLPACLRGVSECGTQRNLEVGRNIYVSASRSFLRYCDGRQTAKSRRPINSVCRYWIVTTNHKVSSREVHFRLQWASLPLHVYGCQSNYRTRNRVRLLSCSGVSGASLTGAMSCPA